MTDLRTGGGRSYRAGGAARAGVRLAARQESNTITIYHDHFTNTSLQPAQISTEVLKLLYDK